MTQSTRSPQLKNAAELAEMRAPSKDGKSACKLKKQRGLTGKLSAKIALISVGESFRAKRAVLSLVGNGCVSFLGSRSSRARFLPTWCNHREYQFYKKKCVCENIALDSETVFEFVPLVSVGVANIFLLKDLVPMCCPRTLGLIQWQGNLLWRISGFLRGQLQHEDWSGGSCLCRPFAAWFCHKVCLAGEKIFAQTCFECPQCENQLGISARESSGHLR